MEIDSSIIFIFFAGEFFFRFIIFISLEYFVNIINVFFISRFVLMMLISYRFNDY